jgi:hypothetical protein
MRMMQAPRIPASGASTQNQASANALDRKLVRIADGDRDREDK